MVPLALAVTITSLASKVPDASYSVSEVVQATIVIISSGKTYFFIMVIFGFKFFCDFQFSIIQLCFQIVLCKQILDFVEDFLGSRAVEFVHLPKVIASSNDTVFKLCQGCFFDTFAEDNQFAVFVD